MTFSKTSLAALASALILTACGGGETDTPAPAENPVETPEVTEVSAPTAPEETNTTSMPCFLMAMS